METYIRRIIRIIRHKEELILLGMELQRNTIPIVPKELNLFFYVNVFIYVKKTKLADHNYFLYERK